MKMYAPGDEIWFDTVGIYTIPAWRTKQKYYHGRVLRPELDASKHGYNYWVDIGFGESVLVHDWNILIRAPYYDDDLIKDVTEEYQKESEKNRDYIVNKLGKMIQEGFKLGIKDWCKETNHVFEVGEFAKILKEDSLFYGSIAKIVDVRYDPKQGRHRYWVANWPHDMFPLEYKQDELELTNEKPKDWEEKKMEKKFTKSELKAGMLVITRNGTRYIVMPTSWGGFGFSNINSYITFDKYSEGLLNSEDKRMDIVKVYGINAETRGFNKLFDVNDKYTGISSFEYPNRNLIWERSEAREMTVAEIEKELGYSIKVVK